MVLVYVSCEENCCGNEINCLSKYYIPCGRFPYLQKAIKTMLIIISRCLCFVNFSCGDVVLLVFFWRRCGIQSLLNTQKLSFLVHGLRFVFSPQIIIKKNNQPNYGYATSNTKKNTLITRSGSSRFQRIIASDTPLEKLWQY